MENLVLTEAELIAELIAAYSHLRVRPLRDYYPDGHYMKDTLGAWIGGESDACVPNGLPIFDPLNCGGAEFGYDGGVHKDFTAWLEARGWYLECEDYGVYMAVSIKETEDWLKANPIWPDSKPAWVGGVVGPSPSFDCPF